MTTQNERCCECGVGPEGPDMAGNRGHVFTCSHHPEHHTVRMTLLEQMPIYGNFHQDEDLWNQTSDLMLDEDAPESVRLRALALIDRICGYTQAPGYVYTRDDLDEVVSEARALLGLDIPAEEG